MKILMLVMLLAFAAVFAEAGKVMYVQEQPETVVFDNSTVCKKLRQKLLDAYRKRPDVSIRPSALDLWALHDRLECDLDLTVEYLNRELQDWR